ncbi:MAG: PTS sugar transporter subunit IIA [Acidobacteria bacterium]|nr:PTS sugar transporter subunit IIA [Acidobacteriota bacterium]
MVGILVISHGQLANELLAAARTIEPALVEQTRAITLEWNVDPEQARAEIARTLKELDTGDGVMVLTDMFGGTPTNLSLGFLDPARSEVVTGVNLPMVIKLAGVRRLDGQTLRQLAKVVAEKGQKSIYVVSEILERRPGSGGHGATNL